MNKTIQILFFSVFLCPVSHSKNIIIDVYGANQSQSQILIKKYSKQIVEIESEFDKETINEAFTGEENTKEMEKNRVAKDLLTAEIKKYGGFLFVYIHTTNYPGYKNLYTTLEVIEKNRPDRLRFVSSQSSTNAKKDSSDLIGKMIEYDKIGMNLVLTNQLNFSDSSCPVYHCTDGFNHPKLSPYLKIFNTGALQEKKLILDTLNRDPDADRRAAAAFLMGHFKDPKEIISILSQHVNDKSEAVRNNVMRVIGETMGKANIHQINVMPFLALLDSPYGTDRNKALFILYEASKSASSKKAIIQNGKENLIALLRLKQPNNHDFTYLILKNISGKTYAENDFKSWEKWFSAV